MRIGIILTGDNTWAGGLYYSLNIIKLLSEISLTKKITVVVFVNNSASKDLLQEIALTNVELVNFDNKGFFYRVYCKLMGILTNSNYRFVQDINSEKLDLLYPLIHYEKGHENLNCRAIYWLYDFQHKFLPELFSLEEIIKRDTNFKEITEKAKTIVLSSKDSKNHLLQFYPICKARLFVYNFVSLIENKNTKSPIGFPTDYLVVCNQFWPHKNHMVVLKGVELLVKANKSIHVVFTGKYDDERNKDYVTKLQSFIKEKNIEGYITFTGFIAREDQVSIIANAKAVIQPSLFEGWSTVIEDAKALNKFLIVSTISIHREQIAENVKFFDPQDKVTLSEHMHQVMNKPLEKFEGNYNSNIEHSKKDLLTLFQIN
ncbi:glycosyltransferase family 4 protein [Aurantibacillus circumpalustris]|uniref:glycosyltransferase family 4 protein n=1 Tax=Aurantibacillus circumpalustris TaxID=3036359 RepID=UPI00295C00E6|nr:glycosyltransferase family 1 protein [Aurantibacillus circumpalustris]